MDSLTFLFFFFLAILLITLPLAIRAQKKINAETRERQNKQSSRITSINTKIFQLADTLLGNSAGSCSALLDKMYEVSVYKCKNAQAEFVTANNITKTLDSYSDWELCGISNTKFFYKLNRKSHWAEQVLRQGSVAGTYKNLCEYVEKEKGGIIDYGQQIWSCISDIEQALSNYRNIHDKVGVSSVSIALQDIQCFKIEGSVQYVSDVSGGGVNLQGAVAGAILGGGAAAVIGSRIGTETTTEIIEKDNRKIVLVYKQDGSLRSQEIKSTDPEKTISVFRSLIPQKEENVAVLNEKKNLQNNASAQFSSADELKKFKELLDCGVISQEEFEAKKKQLLGL